MRACANRVILRTAHRREEPTPQISTNPRTPVQPQEAAEKSLPQPRPELFQNLSELSNEELKDRAKAYLAAKGGFRDRLRGTFVLPPDEEREPERTERILSNPWALRRNCGADSYQQLKSFWLVRVNGGTTAGLVFWYVMTWCNISLSVLTAIGPTLSQDTLVAHIQVSAIISLQLGFGTFCIYCRPDADRILGTLPAAQFIVEG